MPDEQDREQLPEVDDGQPLPTCPIDVEERLNTERVLGSFSPRAPRFKRERLLALVKNVRQPAAAMAPTVRLRTPWYWPAATAAMTGTSLTLAIMLAVRASAEPAVRVEYRDKIVYQTITVPAEEIDAASLPGENLVQGEAMPGAPIDYLPADNYLQSRSVALTQGVDAMAYRQPAAKGEGTPPPATRNELLQQFTPGASMRSAATSKSWIGWPSW